MSEGQTKRRIGQGMKPRDKQAEDKHSHPVTHKDHTEPQDDCVEYAEELPTTEGQPESILEPVLARQEGELSGDHLEPETVQNLDSPETAGVAQSDPLAEALAESGTVPEYEYEDNCYGTGAGKVSTNLTPAEMDATVEKMTEHFVREIMFEGLAEAPWRPSQPQPLGLQPDGSYKIVTTIPEGYLQAVKDWAENDGVTLEEWVNRQLSGYLENWGSPAKGR